MLDVVTAFVRTYLDTQIKIFSFSSQRWLWRPLSINQNQEFIDTVVAIFMCILKCLTNA